MRLVRVVEVNPASEEGEGDEGLVGTRRNWLWYERPEAGDSEGSRFALGDVTLRVHTSDVEGRLKSILERLALTEDLQDALLLAARLHDLGKRRMIFQRGIGNYDADLVLAKSGRRGGRAREHYRHEFGSLLDATDELEFQRLSEEMKDLVLHLIAAHHGRGRPHFPAEEARDYDEAAAGGDGGGGAVAVCPDAEEVRAVGFGICGVSAAGGGLRGER